MITRMLAAGDLARVTASRDFAARLTGIARTRLASAERLSRTCPDAAHAALYAAARHALYAVLAAQGLRPPIGDVDVDEVPGAAVAALLDPAAGAVIGPFALIRQRRRAAEYPAPGTPPVTTADVLRDIPAATAIVDLADRVLDQMPAC